MSESLFDPQSFLDASTTEVLVKRPPIPAGTVLTGHITKIVARPWTGRKDPTQGGIVVDVTVEFDLTAAPPGVLQFVGIDKVNIVDGIMLDLTESGSIDYSPGKNNKLRKYREALDLNVAGASFSIRAMEGRFILCKIKHDPYEGEIYDKIESVAKA